MMGEVVAVKVKVGDVVKKGQAIVILDALAKAGFDLREVRT